MRQARHQPTGEKVAALDVADGGKDRWALCIRYGVDVQCASRGAIVRADRRGSLGLRGSNAERLPTSPLRQHRGRRWRSGFAAGQAGHQGQGWNAAGAVVNRSRKYEGTRSNEDMFANAKAQGWWTLRDRFLEAFKASRGEAYDHDAIISLSPAIEELRELKSELGQVTYRTIRPAKSSSTKRLTATQVRTAPIA